MDKEPRWHHFFSLKKEIRHVCASNEHPWRKRIKNHNVARTGKSGNVADTENNELRVKSSFRFSSSHSFFSPYMNKARNREGNGLIWVSQYWRIHGAINIESKGRCTIVCTVEWTQNSRRWIRDMEIGFPSFRFRRHRYSRGHIDHPSSLFPIMSCFFHTWSELDSYTTEIRSQV